MSKSRMTALLIALAPAVPATAQDVSAEQAMESYRETFESVPSLDCRRDGAPGEIVVCGRPADGPSPYRLPLPTSPAEGERVSGEAVSAVEAAGKRERCSTVGPNQNCSGGLPVIPIIVTVAKALGEALLVPDD